MKNRLHFYITISSAINVFICILLLLFVGSCKKDIDHPKLVVTQDVPSQSLKVKISELKQQGITMKSNVKDVVYYICTRCGYLGPSASDIKLGLEMDTDKINVWLDGYEKQTDIWNYRTDLLPLKIPWKCNTKPEYYSSNTGDNAVVFRKEGILLFHRFE